ncbi:guanylate cyclase [Plakobranchus ocellatus]|uniref:Guanylate cyclase n=1 Tax=Plakobranchus ocellatus TaxID=259542 RepID=A0AAV4BZ35_9GAST|nr:guanylate cyclase [Plakobranchus ocellatus]
MVVFNSESTSRPESNFFPPLGGVGGTVSSESALHIGIFEHLISNKTVLAYRHFFSIVHTPPLDPKYNEFKQIVDRYLELPPFNLTNELKEMAKSTRQIRPEASYLYDAVMLYAEVVTEIILEGGDYTDGKEIIGRIQGRTYKSAFGYLTKINENGDAQGNFSVIMCKHKEGMWGMYPVGTFRHDPQGGSLPQAIYSFDDEDDDDDNGGGGGGDDDDDNDGDGRHPNIHYICYFI